MKGAKGQRKLVKANIADGSTIIVKHPQPKHSNQINSKSKKEPNNLRTSTAFNNPQPEQGMDLSVVPNNSHPSSSSSSSIVYTKAKRYSTEPLSDSLNSSGQLQRVLKPVNVVDPLMATSVDMTVSTNNLDGGNHSNTSAGETLSGSVIPSSISHLDLINGPKCWRDSCNDEKKYFQREIDSLRSQLDVQVQVNSELKKLLVASLGEDLQYRVEKLLRDKAQLSLEVGGYTKKVSEDYENLDRLSIQADIWRSKFMASRVLIDELAKGRGLLSSQYQESQDAIQRLLNERHELQSHLMESYKFLKQVNEAFDPLNSQNLFSLPNTSNILELVKLIQQLSEAIRFRLLPGRVSLPSSTSPLQSGSNFAAQNALTPAEAQAQEVLYKEVSQLNESTMKRIQSVRLLPPDSLWMDRYHHTIQYDNLTINCCSHCKGDIFVA
ncbi:golgin-45 isoform X1 [Octopus bimaculoides]|uniref:Golgin-45 n=2 Tax=Octopus bimaculoides TaxID=37653 RepID=A0A0L8GMK1_OCTBM|nr:golgin-45 isoform X1 [Octopus bimaculoides]|eukprot:XP_014779668.1 PREDICTED: golgin-45-like isoform X1 [Octopus bimaculoides]